MEHDPERPSTNRELGCLIVLVIALVVLVAALASEPARLYLGSQIEPLVPDSQPDSGPIVNPLVPEYPGARLVSTDTDPEGTLRLTKEYVTTAKPSDVMDFYYWDLTQHGWTWDWPAAQNPTLHHDRRYYNRFWNRYNYRLSVSARESGNQTAITVEVERVGTY